MPISVAIQDFSSTGKFVSNDMFGGNYLFHRNDTEKFAEAANMLDMGPVRFPGGSITEHSFDVNNPDTLPENFDANGVGNYTSLTEFLEMCNTYGLSPTIVIPTVPGMRDGDLEGHAGDVKDFVSSVMDRTGPGNEFPNVTIKSFEIGNEYWGWMTAEEYGGIANALTKSISQGLDDAGVPDGEQPSILVQMANPSAGRIFEYAPGGAFHNLAPGSERALELGLTDSDFNGNDLKYLKKIEVQNKLLIDQFDSEARAEIGGLVEHFYYHKEHLDDPQYVNDSHSIRFMDHQLEVWRGEGFDQNLHITEWNVGSANYAQMGLQGAGSLVYQLEQMVRLDVEAAYVWPVMHNTANALAGNYASDPELTAFGGIFSMMSENLVGTELLESTLVVPGLELISFEGESGIYTFIINRTGEQMDIDFSQPEWEYGSVDITLVGLTVDSDGEHWHQGIGRVPVPDYADRDALTVLERSELTLERGETLNLSLSPFEIILVSSSLTEEEEWGGGAVIDLGEGNNRYRGTRDDDWIRAGDGNNRIFGLSGDDRIVVGDGDNRLAGQGGNDTITAGDGDNTIFGQGGHDVIRAGDGNNTIWGGVGRDNITVGNGNNHVTGGKGNDTIEAGFGNDTIHGGPGDDLIRAHGGFNHLTGGEGDDTIFGGWGADTIWGGPGDDLIRAGGGGNVVNGGQGNDTIYSGFGNDTLHGGPGQDYIRAYGGDNEITGGGGDDTLIGGSGDDSIWGGAGHDLLYSTSGENILYGGGGNDTLVAGDGSDTMVGGGGADVFRFQTGGDHLVRDLNTGQGDRIELSRDLFGENLSDADRMDIVREAMTFEDTGLMRITLSDADLEIRIRGEFSEDDEDFAQHLAFI